MELNPRNTVYGSKRLIGRPFASQAVQQMKSRFHYEIIEGPKHEAAVRIVGKNFSLQQVAAFILTEIRDIARDLLQEEVNRAVITVPAYFNENQREAVREAGILAGLQVERILNEPTAAALAFGYDRGLDQRVLVYDLGGGTFDATVLELCGNVYEVVSTGGDTFLGGVDFDNQLVDYLLDAFCREIGVVPQLDRSAMQRLRDAAEQAKCALSEKEETIVRIPFFAAIDNTPKDLEVRVARALLEDMVTPLVERTMLVATNVLEKAKLRPEQIRNVLLVGGQSRMPMIWRRIKELFGREPHKGVHPDEAVAIGAALLADSQGKIDSVVLIDVLPVSIGIGIPGGRFLRVLEGGTALPTTKTYTIRTFRDDQESLELAVFQGDGDRVVDNEYLGTVTVSGITTAPKGAIQLEITFSLNQECLLKVSSRELQSGKIIETQMGVKDTEDTLRKKLKIPEQEISMRKYGVPRSLRQAEKKPPLAREHSPEEKKDVEEKTKEKGGLLGKLFGRKK
jgi:molecular chaperone DnaK